MQAFNELKAQYDFVSDVRGLGLMIGIDVEIPTADILNKATEKGLVLLTAGTKTVRLLPMLNITDAEVDLAIQIINEIFQELNHG